MTQEIIVTYLHYIGFMVLFGSLVMEHLLIKPSLSREEIKRLATVDAIYGISALLVFMTGVLKLMKYGKGAEYYMSTWVFHAKLTLFIVAAFMSIMPTIKILKARKASTQNEQVELPKFIKHIVRLELLIIALLPLLAAMMARGVGVKP
jgi:putative membrane protein